MMALGQGHVKDVRPLGVRTLLYGVAFASRDDLFRRFADPIRSTKTSCRPEPRPSNEPLAPVSKQYTTASHNPIYGAVPSGFSARLRCYFVLGSWTRRPIKAKKAVGALPSARGPPNLPPPWAAALPDVKGARSPVETSAWLIPLSNLAARPRHLGPELGEWAESAGQIGSSRSRRA